MVYLLSETSYDELYGTDATPIYYLAKNRFLRLLEKADPQKYFENDCTRRNDVLEEAHKLIALLASHQKVTFRDLYLYGDQEPYRSIIRHFEELIRLNKYEFCFPFTKYGTDETVLDHFLLQYGCYSLYELVVFSKKQYPTSCGGTDWNGEVEVAVPGGLTKRVALAALAHPFLLSDPAAPARPFRHITVETVDSEKLRNNKCDDPNHMCCSGATSCEYVLSSKAFCSFAEDGTCSIVSCGDC